jgi:hypothetical protein
MSALIERQAADLVQSMPPWLSRFLNWSVKFWTRGPRWIPGLVRRTPLEIGSFVVKLYARGYR